MENIISLFIEQAKKNPDAIAIIENGNKVSYATLLNEVKETAAYFHAKGLKPKDSVLVFVPISLDLYRTVLALFYVGASAVFVDEWVSFQRLSLCCKMAECRAFIAPFKLKILSFLSAELRNIPIKLSLNGRDSNKNIPLYKPEQDSTALITFTTGSTGTPKAANRTHEFLHAQFNALKPLLDAKLSEIDLTMLPIVLLLNLGLGKTSVIPAFNTRKPKKFKAESLAKQIEVNQVEVLITSPFYLISLSEYLVRNNIKIKTIRKIFTGGAPVFPNEAQLITKAFPEANTRIVFGSTEAEPISHIKAQNLANTEKELLNGLCAGTIDPQTSILILPIQETAITPVLEEVLKSSQLQNGLVGEICITGKHVLTSYIKNPEAMRMNKIMTEKNIWHRTGDAGFIGNDGQLYLVGRCKQIIHNDGETYYPFMIEDFCRKQSDVSIGTMVLRRDKPVLVLEVKKTFNKQTFESNAKVNQLDFEILILKNIPRDARHFSKIDYTKLSQKIA